MTKEQAIKVLKPILETYVDYANIAMTVGADNDAEAIEIAIESLKAPKVIYCNDCVYAEIYQLGIGLRVNCKCRNGLKYPFINSFCSYAERRTDETD